MDEIKQKVFQVLAEKMSLDINTIHTDSHLVNDLGLDSLGAVEMLFDLESQYDIEISNEDAKKFVNPQNIIDYLKSNIEQKTV